MLGGQKKYNKTCIDHHQQFSFKQLVLTWQVDGSGKEASLNKTECSCKQHSFWSATRHVDVSMADLAKQSSPSAAHALTERHSRTCTAHSIIIIIIINTIHLIRQKRLQSTL